MLQKDLFAKLPLAYKKCILDCLYYILRKNIYNIVRFRCCYEDTVVRDGQCGIVHILLTLLESDEINHCVSVCMRMIRLLGVICNAGIIPSEAKRFLRLLKEPSSLSLCLLQSLKNIIKQDDAVVKAAPLCFFNFGGAKSGLIARDVPFPFSREYCIMLWFRVENFDLSTSSSGESSSDILSPNPSRLRKSRKKQHIITYINDITKNGIDIFIQNQMFNIVVYDNGMSASGVQNVGVAKPVHHITLPNNPLKSGIWYNLCVRHSKPRISFFSKDELSILLDQQLIFQDAVKFPNMVPPSATDAGVPSAKMACCTLTCGLNLNGQMGPIYFFHEVLPTPFLDVLSKASAGKQVDGISSSGPGSSNVVNSIDMNSSVSLSRDRKSLALQSKVAICFHPSRCRNGSAIDVHSNFVANFGSKMHVWEIVSFRDILMSIGGIGVLLPLWPFLLIESHEESEEEVSEVAPDSVDDARQSEERNVESNVQAMVRRLSATAVNSGANTSSRRKSGGNSRKLNEYSAGVEAESGGLPVDEALSEPNVKDETGLGLSIVEVYRDPYLKYCFTSKTRREVDGELLDITDDGVIGLLLYIFAKCLHNHHVHISWMIKLNAIEMIEYALQCAPAKLLCSEGEHLALALLQLRSSVKAYEEVEKSLLLRLLCNIKIWCRASVKLQNSLMSVTIAAMRAQPEIFIEVIGVQTLIDYVTSCYLDETEEDVELVKEYRKLCHLASEPPVERVGEQVPASPVPADTRSESLSSNTDSATVSPTPVKAVRRRSNFTLLLSSVLGSASDANADVAHVEVSSPAVATDSEPVDLSPGKSENLRKNLSRRQEILSILAGSKRHRARMRGCVYEMITVLVLHSMKERDVRPLIDFMGDCKDLKVMNEVAQLLLSLIVEGGSKVVSVIIEACKGIEEFASFILFHFLNKSVEEVRCTGLKILTHFYVRTDGVPASMLSLTVRAAKEKRYLSRALDALSTSVGESNRGINRMYTSGGLVLLTEFVLNYSNSSSEKTYMALLELLLTKSANSIHSSVEHVNRLDVADACLNPIPVVADLPTPDGNCNDGLSDSRALGSLTIDPDVSESVTSPAVKVAQDEGSGLAILSPKFDDTVGHRTVHFTVNLMHPDLSLDDSSEVTNAAILPVFFNILPKLSDSARSRVYGDLLALLKHGAVVRDAVSAEPSWHVCMFELMSCLIIPQPLTRYHSGVVKSANLCQSLNHWGKFFHGSEVNFDIKNSANAPVRTLRQRLSITGGGLLRAWNRDSTQIPEQNDAKSISPESSFDLSPKNSGGLLKKYEQQEFQSNDTAAQDLNFAIGVKIQATLLLHSMESRSGWRELLFTIGQSIESKNGVAVSQAVLSHVLSELTFTMKSKYKNLQKMAKSSNYAVNQSAMTKLDNLLALILVAGLFTVDASVASMNIHHLFIGRKRVQFLKDAQFDHNSKCDFECNASIHDQCLDASDLCEDCGHSLSLHPPKRSAAEEAEENLCDYMQEKRNVALNVYGSFMTAAAADDEYCGKTMKLGRALGGNQNTMFNDIQITSIDGEYDDEDDARVGHDTSTPENNFLSPTTPSGASRPTKPRDESVIKLAHNWFDLSMNHGNPPFNKRVDGATPSGIADDAQNRKMVSDDELIRPIERNYGFVRARLILSLQIVRFFDSIFWPNASGSVRNVSMLKYQNDFILPHNVNAAVGNSGSTSLHRSHTASNMFGASGGTANVYADDSGGESSPTGYFPSLTLYSSILRICLFILQELSPFSDMAELNIRRMRALLSVMEKVPSVSISATPHNDWLMVILIHVTINLQRISVALGPVFNLIVRQAPSIQRSFGGNDNGVPLSAESKPPSTYGHFPEVSAEARAELDSLMDSGLENPQVIKQLENLFEHAAGRRLMSFIRSSVYLVLDCYEMKRSVLLKVLPDEIFMALTSLVVLAKNENLRRCDATPGQPFSPVPGGGYTGAYKSGTGGGPDQVNLQSEPEDAMDAMFTKYHAKKESFTASLLGSTSLSASSPVPRGGPLVHASVDIASPNSSVWKDSGDMEGSTGTPFDAESEDGSDDDFRLRSSTIASSFEDREILANSAKTSDVLNDIVVPLRWLRASYLECDLLRSEQFVEAIDSVEQHENDGVAYFKQKLRNFGHIVNSSVRESELALKNEVRELTEVASTVSTMINTRESSRQLAKRSQESDRIRHVAELWHDCLKRFESDWSPWCVGPSTSTDGSAPDASAIQNEMGRHKDCYLRRMLITKGSEVVDLSDCAYLETKQKMNQILEEATDQEKEVLMQLRRRQSVSDGEEIKESIVSKKRSDSFIMKSLLISGGNASSHGDTEAEWGDYYDTGDGDEGDKANEDTPNTSGLGQIFQSAVAEKRPPWTRFFQWAPDEKILLSMSDVCDLQCDQVMTGTLLITNKCLYFHPIKKVGGLRANPKPGTFKNRCWHINRITEMYGRRYLLQNCAVELFFLFEAEVFLAFSSSSALQTFFKLIRKQLYLPMICTPASLNPKYVFSQSHWTELWRRRVISNFDYLMQLNKVAGRSYNDLTQYPVFPWILSDYTSDTIDFNNPAVFRDLGKPVGALNPTKLKEIMDRYGTFDDCDEIPRFMYGSHYSSAGVVMYFLLRQQPFSSLAVSLQGGRFDCPDRLFFDMSSTWSGVNNSMSDVKELIPEMFCFPELLSNLNGLPLGELQDGTAVDNVKLPPWCKGSPHEFIRLHREALESEYVSMNLHRWIDLIFGYKQTGQAAIDSYNVFYYLTYENALPGGIDAIEDDLQREAIKAQVTHFGQTPSQLFSKQHPQRMSITDTSVPLCSKLQTLHKLRVYAVSGGNNAGGHGAVISVTTSGNEKLIVVYADLSVGSFKWSSVPDSNGNPFQIRPDKQKSLFSGTPALNCLASNSADSVHRCVPGWGIERSGAKGHHSHSRKGQNKNFETSASLEYRYSPDSFYDPDAVEGIAEEPAAVTPPRKSSFMGFVMGGETETTPVNESSMFSKLSTRIRSGSLSFKDTPPPVPIVTNVHTAVPGNKEPGPPSAPSPATHSSIKSLSSAALASEGSRKDALVSLRDVLENVVDDDFYRYCKKAAARSVGVLFQDDFIQPFEADEYPPRDRNSYLNLRRSAQSIAICGGMLGTTNSNGGVASSSGAVPKILSCGYWDNSIRINNLDNNLKEVASIEKGHLGQVTAVCSCNDNYTSGSRNVGSLGATQYSTVITGGIDGTCRVWMLDMNWHPSGPTSNETALSPIILELCSPGLGMEEKESYSVSNNPAVSMTQSSQGLSSPLQCIKILWGHETPINALYYSNTLDLAVSASMNGLICLHSVSNGEYIRSIADYVGARTIEQLYIAPLGYIVVYSVRSADVPCSSPRRKQATWRDYEDDLDSVDSSSDEEVTPNRMKCEMCLEVFGLNGDLLSSVTSIKDR